MEVIKSYNLFLDSSQRDYSDSGNPASYLLYLRKPITKLSKSSQFRLKIFQACIPFSFTQINNTNNVIDYTYNSSSYYITIPVGSYSITALLSYLQTYLQTAHSIALNFTFNISTNLATFAFASTQTGFHTISFIQSSNPLLIKQLGFLTNITFQAISGTLVNATSTQSVNVSPSKNLYIRSDNFQQGDNAQEAISTKASLSDILAIIPINVPFSNYINYYDTTAFYVYINNESIDAVSLYLTDATSDDTLTGLLLNWSCSITIEEVMLKNNLNIDNIIGNNIQNDNNKLIDELEKEKSNTISELEKEKERILREIDTFKKKGNYVSS